MLNKKTYSQKPAEINRQWILLDASKAPLGRLAVCVANYLIGKHKPTYTAHVDNGEHVVVINAKQLVVTGNKLTDKKYYRHSGYIGSLKEVSLSEVLIKDPAFAIKEAVRGMLPKNKLSADRLKRLHIYAGAEHQHLAQSPKEMEIK